MTWGDLFEAARGFEVTHEAVSDTLAAHRRYDE